MAIFSENPYIYLLLVQSEADNILLIMIFKSHEHSGALIAEIEAEGIVIDNLEDALQVLGDAYYNGYDRILVRIEQLNPDFFDLSTRLAGDILQKFAQYRMGLIIRASIFVS